MNETNLPQYCLITQKYLISYQFVVSSYHDYNSYKYSVSIANLIYFIPLMKTSSNKNGNSFSYDIYVTTEW